MRHVRRMVRLPQRPHIHGIMSEMARSEKAGPGSFAWCTALLERHVLPRTSRVFCNSSFTESVIRERTARTSLVPNPVRQEFFSTQRLASRATPPVLINVGVITSNKRQLELLSIVRRLRQQGHRFLFRFLGQSNPADPYAAKFLEEIKAVTADTTPDAASVRYDGLVLDQDLIAAFDHASALIHFPRVESFGLAVAEGLARGLKLFGNRCGGVVEVAQQAEGAELFDLDDYSGLEKALGRWLEEGAPMPVDPGASVRERYHPAVIARRHVEIYREVLGNPEQQQK